MGIYIIAYTTCISTIRNGWTHTSYQHHIDRVLAENADMALLHFDNIHADHMCFIKSVEIIDKVSADYGG